jgi:uncharacterized protein (DUF1800 family)
MSPKTELGSTAEEYLQVPRGATNRQIEHLLRRAGFGARPDELEYYGQMSTTEAVDALLNYESIADDVDMFIGKSGYVGTTTRGVFSPQSNVTDARQRWLFRMVHSDRPLQEKMTLFWHNHFATAYSKIAGALGATEATRYLAARPGEDPARVRGQIEMLRDNALGNFRDMLVNIAKDTAMLVWLDGRTNTKAKPQENFAREIMELFTVGVGNYTESDVYAGARVFTGWNLIRTGNAAANSTHVEFIYNAGQHETSPKTFSFPVYPDGNNTIPGRSAADGMQDGIDFINGLAANPNTGRYLAGKLWRFFVSEFRDPDPTFVDRIASAYQQNRYEMRPVMREVLLSSQFWASHSYWARYSWPVEFVVRAIKDVGWTGFSVDTALTPLANMGQSLFEPPDVAGWDAGKTWFTTGAMLARMNFASTITANQRFNLTNTVKIAGASRSADSMLSYFLDEIATSPLDGGIRSELSAYLRATGAWTGTDAQLQAKAPGLVHLLVGAPEYQLC